MKKTVVLGASTNPARYSYFACQLLEEAKIDYVPVGIKKGKINDKEILDLRKTPEIDDVHTITLYLNPMNQKEWYKYIISLKPTRIIFNPGTENNELMQMASESGIDTLFACSLVLLQTGQF